MRYERRIKKRKAKVRFFLSTVMIISLLGLIMYNILSDKLNLESRSGSSSDEPTPILVPDDSESRTSQDPEPPISESFIDYQQEGGILELPVNGASGYASVQLNLHEGSSTDANVIYTLNAGQGFTILEESNDWWKIEVDGLIGWVIHKYCLINLPDVIPSIVYNNTNTYSSKLVSSGKEIPNITGQELYMGFEYNERLGEEEYIMPALYSMALKISEIQQTALSDGNTLIIYEAYRPYEVQRKIVDNLSVLVNTDSVVKEGIINAPWTIGWFIATGISNHQKGYAIDVSLGKVTALEANTTGSYIYDKVREYDEYTMPTEIHELSTASVIFKSPVSSRTDTAWRTAEPSDTMNKEALLLQNYCTNAGLTPLASEWWHFNDLSCAEFFDYDGSYGRFFIQSNYSVVPISEEKAKYDE